MHSYNKSLSLISGKILNIENNISKIKENNIINPGMIDMDVIEDKKHSMEKYCQELLLNIIKSIDLNGMKDKSGKYLKDFDIVNVISIFIELIKTTRYFYYNYAWGLFINEHIFKILEKNPTNEKQQIIYNYFIILLTQILNKERPAYQEKGKIYPEFDYENIFYNLKRNYWYNFVELIIIFIPKILATNFIESSKENKLI